MASVPEDRMLVINYSRMPQFKVKYTDQNPSIMQKDGAAVLWKHWRLLENRELYDLKVDPMQEKDVAADHPEVFEKLQKHLNLWWSEVKDLVLQPQRVIIGNEAENPAMLTACEWLDVFVDQQLQIRRGVRKNGLWYLVVDQPGTYEFELRRYPRESGFSLQDSLPATIVTDGQLPKGTALPVSQARIRVGEVEKLKKTEINEKSAIFNLPLQPGETTLQTWLEDENGAEICGAYYVYVNRLK